MEIFFSDSPLAIRYKVQGFQIHGNLLKGSSKNQEKVGDMNVDPTMTSRLEKEAEKRKFTTKSQEITEKVPKRQCTKSVLNKEDESKLPAAVLPPDYHKPPPSPYTPLPLSQILPPRTVELKALAIKRVEVTSDDAKVKAIKDVLENSKDVNSNLIVKKMKHILEPMKYSEEYFEEDETKIKLEADTVKTEPFIKAESIKTEPEDDTNH